jgi:RNA-directed DNA polymerase
LHEKESATTGNEQELPEAFAVNGRGLPGKLFTLRQKLYLKAKREPKFRFYTLYGLIHRLDVLEAAWDSVAGNEGGSGVDGVTIESIEATPGGREELLAVLQQELREKRYKPQAVRRVYIPKPDGRKRPLGIPTIRDRVVQTAALLVLEPIFEADFLDCSYGYRPRRSAKEALEQIDGKLRKGYTAVYDADLQAYFDTIPHDKLMKCVERRIADRSVLRLIRQWLRTPVEERDEDGRPKVSRPESGTPQGGVISPLLANLYLHWFDLRFYRDGPGNWARAHLVRYADDFVIMARFIDGRITGWVERTVEEWLGLKINRKKTRVIRLTPDGNEGLDFLGYSFRYEWGYTDRTRRFLTASPSAKAIASFRQSLREITDHRVSFVPVAALVRTINRRLRGWSNYFSFGFPWWAYKSVNSFTINRLTIHLRRRSQRPCRPPAGMSYYSYLIRRLGLQLLQPRTTSPIANG